MPQLYQGGSDAGRLRPSLPSLRSLRLAENGRRGQNPAFFLQ